MAGAFEEQQKQSDEAKAAALAALARGGTAALAEHQAAQDQLAALRQQAATGALQRAAAINAPAGLGEQQAAAGSGVVFGRYATDQQRAAAARQQALADMAAANSQYFSQVDAARPIVENRAKAAWDAKEAARILAEQRAQQAEADREAARQARELEQQWRVEDRQNKLADRAASAAKELTPGNIITALGGQTVAGNVINKAVAAQKQTLDNQIRSKLTFGLGRRSDAQIADDVASRLGLPQGYGQALTGIVAPKPVNPKQAAHRTDVVTRVKQHASKNTYDTFLDVVVGRPKQYDDLGEIVDRGVPAATTMAEALNKVKQLTDAQLKYAGVSRDVLVRWLQDYYSV